MADQFESCKVVLLGESGVGKTSIISQFTEESFMEEQGSTSGATFSNKSIELDNGQIIKLEIWDTAGQERYRALAKMFYKDATIAILVYDITRKESFNELKNYWAEQVKENAPKNIVLAIAGNKSDLVEQEVVDEGEARNFASSIKAIFRMTSAKNSEGISELFTAIANKIADPNFDGEKIRESKEKQRGHTVKIIKDKHVQEQNREKKKNNCC